MYAITNVSKRIQKRHGKASEHMSTIVVVSMFNYTLFTRNLENKMATNQYSPLLNSIFGGSTA